MKEVWAMTSSMTRILFMRSDFSTSLIWNEDKATDPLCTLYIEWEHVKSMFLLSGKISNMADTFWEKFTVCAKVCGLFFLIVRFGCWLAGQENSDHMGDVKAMRLRNFYSMNFLLIWYKDFFRVPDMNFDKKSRINRFCLVTMVTMVTRIWGLYFDDHNLKNVS